MARLSCVCSAGVGHPTLCCGYGTFDDLAMLRLSCVCVCVCVQCLCGSTDGAGRVPDGCEMGAGWGRDGCGMGAG